jgi:hypothetical protein
VDSEAPSIQWVIATATLMFSGCACSRVPGCNNNEACVTYETYCAEIEQVLRCTQPQACGIAASDVSCDQIRPWPQFDVTVPCPGPLGAAIDAGLVVFNPAAAGAALQALQTDCGATLGVGTIFQGTLRLGSACNGMECVPGSYCDQSAPAAGECGSCRSLGTAGTRVDSPEACSTDTVEWSADAGFVCANFVGDGGPCSVVGGPSSCARGLSCQGNGSSTQICLPWKGLGTPCAADEECGVNLCRGSPPRCVAWARRGEACAADADPNLPFCQLGYACTPTPLGINVCGDRIPLGGSCVTDLRGCIANASCVGNVCVALGVQSAPCVSAHDCLSGFVCNSGQSCADPAGDGDVCVAAADCAPGFYCDQLICRWAPCIP